MLFLFAHSDCTELLMLIEEGEEALYNCIVLGAYIHKEKRKNWFAR